MNTLNTRRVLSRKRGQRAGSVASQCSKCFKIGLEFAPQKENLIKNFATRLDASTAA